MRGDSGENDYVYASTVHWKPIANGYSGYMAESYLELARRVPYVPHDDGFELLREMGITHLVVHTGKAERMKVLRRWEGRFGTGPDRWMERVYQEPGISIYRLVRAASSPRSYGFRLRSVNPPTYSASTSPVRSDLDLESWPSR